MAVWTIAQASEALREDRLDADFFKPDDLSHVQEALKAGGQALSNLAEVKNGRTPAFYEETEEVPVVRSGDLVTPLIFPGNGQAYLRTAQNRQHFSLKTGDVLISSIGMGSIGKVGIVLEQANFVTVSEVSVLRNSSVSPELLFAYLSTPKGQAQIERQITGATGQQHLLKSKVEKIIIPKVGSSIQESVKKRVTLAAVCFSNAKKEYEEAEAILNAALGLDCPDLVPRLFYEDTFAHAAAVGRFDPEYYQPAKWNVLRALAAMPGKPLEEHFRSVKKLWQPNEQPSTATVRDYDLTDALMPFLDDTTPMATVSEIKSTKKRFEPGDLVVSRLRSYLKEIAVVFPSTGAPLVGSTEFIVLRSLKTGLSAEALLVFLRSAPVQTVLKWCQDGSNHPRFAEKELLRLPVPDAVVKVQGAICEKIREAITARQESRRLLDEAKRTVERAIEGGS